MEQVNILMDGRPLPAITPKVCGHHDCDPGYRFGPAVRDYYLLHYVGAGWGELASPRGSCRVGPGQLFVIRPGEVNTYMADRRDPWRYTWVGFAAGEPLEEFFPGDVLQLPPAKAAPLFAALRDCGALGPGRELDICGKIYQLLALLRETFPAQDRARRHVAMVINYIHTNYMQEMRVERMAADLGLERSYFSTLFKEATGKSPQQYMVEYRLEQAAALLAAGHRPGEAATQAGYGDASLFYRMFKRKFGVAPSHYRKAHTPQKGDA